MCEAPFGRAPTEGWSGKWDRPLFRHRRNAAAVGHRTARVDHGPIPPGDDGPADGALGPAGAGARDRAGRRQAGSPRAHPADPGPIAPGRLGRARSEGDRSARGFLRAAGGPRVVRRLPGGRPVFHAVLRPLSGVAQVHLADVSLAWRADGGYAAVALLDVETAGRRKARCGCPKARGWWRSAWRESRQPGGGRPQPLETDVFPQRPARSASRWSIDGLVVGADVLGTRRFESPTLEGHPVRQTLWTISGPPSLWPGKAVGCSRSTAWSRT